MGEAALRCFMCKGENTIVGASAPWPTTWRKPLISQCTRRWFLPYGAGTLPQERAQTALLWLPMNMGSY